MVYEKKLSSLPKVVNELRTLDPDAGIRSLGRFSSRKCFIFITKSVNIYTTALYSIKTVKKESLPDKRLLVKEFQTLEELETFLAGIITKPVKAFAY